MRRKRGQGQLKILVVDDQGFNITAIQVILRVKFKLNVDQVMDKALGGQQAIDMVRKNIVRNNFDKCDYILILMDCNMPFVDGYQATDTIRHLFYQYGLSQPIISAVTGHSETVYINKAINSGMNQVLSKPVSIPALRRLLLKVKFI